MRTLGLDLGSKTLGVSVSDALGMIARPVETLRFESDDYDSAFEQVKKYIKEFQITTAVLGLPKHMNGDVGIRGEISYAFKEKLETLGIEVVLWDERLTTVAAEKILIAGNVSRKKRKKVIDQMAAVQILQSYLDSKY
ncbi:MULTISPECIES: Holliday junction resolvase RuvX [Bacillota]|jgi:putative Holliday junction resolvase|uniref:Putative pre-16S rRNA nuclease n=2 Tax=Amedibacillus TaxID=2749846 RepID=A0A7G9GLY1_9FIRM|nr:MULTISPECIES: Holliday junction resolvase RuvX [Bacillota]QNM11813.1 Holliday junction resolvase RuvX [[Eubacterium] hominis]MCH4287264.1 Holliday junction resolvase RuvX [Amedibacillus hominis]RGB50677.1 Holliday junction resolvase RuvX [Absiella sp. AM22-9]RGB62954.1 Holliday junction resolvase RuvX [Absiella sp. AM10-20]RGB64879.1 Holliday junction resolvase RuvX [Absiella sp. AM09-45]